MHTKFRFSFSRTATQQLVEFKADSDIVLTIEILYTPGANFIQEVFENLPTHK